jgi:hypothetical protein
MHSFLSVRHIIISLTTIVMFTGLSGSACSSSPSTKTCSADEVKKCDDGLTQCTTAAPCDDPTNPGYQGCVDSCKKKDCDCQSACGNTCN